jgi:hypothetical protein
MPTKVHPSATVHNVGNWCNATTKDRAVDTEQLLYQRAGATKRTHLSKLASNGVLSADDVRELSYLKGAQNFLVDVGARLHHISDKCNPADPLTKLQDPSKLADFIKASKELDPTVVSRAGRAEPAAPVPADGSDVDTHEDTDSTYIASSSTTDDSATPTLPRFGTDLSCGDDDIPASPARSPSTFADRIAALFTHSIAFILPDISDADELMDART